MKYPNLFILRHGETIWNQQGRVQGRLDSPLSVRGEMQALRQMELLRSLKELPTSRYSSPQGRAQKTAELALGSLENVVLETRLQEINFGDWEGITRNEIQARVPYSMESGKWYFQSPNGENYDKVVQRVRSFLDDLTDPAIIVTHGMTSVVLRGLWLGLQQREMLELPLDQGCIFALADGRETILR